MTDWRRTHLWGHLTRTEIAEARDAGALPVLPLGAIEQHSGHLPVDTDASSAFGVSLRAAERCAKAHILVLPVQSFGFSMHHKTWAGTLTLSANTLIALIEDIGESLDRTGFKRMLVVNGHGGNEGALLSACNSLICRGIGMGYVNYFNPGRPAWLQHLRGQHRDLGHACAYETSIQMALKADQRSLIAERSAHLEPRLAPTFSAGGDDLAELRQGGLVWSWLYNPGDVGYYGDPAAARDGNPDDVLDATVGALAGFFDEFSDAPLMVGPRP